VVRCPSFGWAWASVLYHSIVSNISVNRCPSLTVTGCRTERLVQHCGRWPASDVTVDVIGDVTPLLLLAQILYTAMTSDNRYHSRRTLSIYAASVRQSSQRRLLLSSTLSAIFLTLLACGSVYVTTRCPSVCLSVCSIMRRSRSRFAAVGPASRRYRSIAARRVCSRRVRLYIDPYPQQHGAQQRRI